MISTFFNHKIDQNKRIDHLVVLPTIVWEFDCVPTLLTYTSVNPMHNAQVCYFNMTYMVSHNHVCPNLILVGEVLI